MLLKQYNLLIDLTLIIKYFKNPSNIFIFFVVLFSRSLIYTTWHVPAALQSFASMYPISALYTVIKPASDTDESS
jgi:hypothetical protein